MKKRFWILTIFLLLITCNLFINSYGLFETNNDAEIIQETGKWVIKLNNVDISSEVTNNFTIDDFYYAANSNVESGYIAPGVDGYFDITIDPKGTDVAVKYSIYIDLSGNYLDNISFSVEDLSNGNATLIALNTYAGVISLNDIKNDETVTIRVNISWDDNELYDEDDTLMSENNRFIPIPVEVNVIQYLGEDITSSLTYTDSECFNFNTGVIDEYYSNIGNDVDNDSCPLNVSIPNKINDVTVTEISNAAFLNSNINSLVLPNTITSIGNNAFKGNNISGKLDLSYLNNLVLGTEVFSDNAISSIKLPNNVVNIPNGLFKNNNISGVLDIRYLSNLTSIGSDSFNNNNISSIKFNGSITGIGSGAFSNNSLTEVIIPESITSIGSNAFYKSDLSNSSLSKIVNKTGLAFDWNLIINGVSDTSFETGIVSSEYGDVVITNN